jgi:hypothetical protein
MVNYEWTVLQDWSPISLGGEKSSKVRLRFQNVELRGGFCLDKIISSGSWCSADLFYIDVQSSDRRYVYIHANV